jgi:ferredoxin
VDLDVITGLALVLVGAAALLCLGGFALISFHEREPRAVRVACIVAAASALSLFLAAAAAPVIRSGAVVFLVTLGLAASVVWFWPVGVSVAGHGRPARRVDERDIMFARIRLEPGTSNYDDYYARRPEHRESDDRTRALPGLLSPDATLAEPLSFASARASFRMTHTLRDWVDGSTTAEPIERPATEMTAIVKRLALDFGALDVGVTELRPYHVYSHVGRGSGRWGEPIEVEHRWAIAFTVEMDHQTMRCAPAAPVLAESARQYVESAKIAVQLAAAIRNHGYPARAHIDGNYRVIAPLVARDAGLGELGRMAILMTPTLGPRVRLGVVTTDAPLVADTPGDDPSVIDFCTICKKCAENCPSRSIPFGDREPIDDGLRWAIDPDGCFRHWNAIGTDCGRCMTVCPYSHPDNPAHNIVRWAARRSGAARRGALLLDDLFYGRRPRPRRPGPR